MEIKNNENEVNNKVIKENVNKDNIVYAQINKINKNIENEKNSDTNLSQNNLIPISNNNDNNKDYAVSKNVKSKLMERLNRGKIRSMAQSAEKAEHVNKNEDIMAKAKMLENVLARGNRAVSSQKEDKVKIEYESNENENKIENDNNIVVNKKKKKKKSEFNE